LKSYNCEIIAITETWLKVSIKLTAFGSDYQVFRQDRPIGNGGGVLLAVKQEIPCKIVLSTNINRCDCLIVDIQHSNNSDFVRYCLVYRPPDVDLEGSLEVYNTIFHYLQNTKHYVLLGDFNLPDIKWDTLNTVSNVSKEFLTLCFKIGAEQMVDFPTRLNNCLDLILCSNRSMVKTMESEPPFCESDHISIYCELLFHRRSQENVCLKPCFQKADYSLINAYLSTLDWDIVYRDCTSTNQYWSAFKNIIDTAIYNFVPFVQTRKSKCVPWFTNNLKHLRLHKQRKWRKYTRSRNIVTHAEYKLAAQNFKSEFIKEKCKYEERLFADMNSNNKFYSYIKSQTSVNTALPSIEKSDGSIAVTDSGKASEFSKYFSSVFVEDNGVLPEFNPNCTDSLDNFTCSVRDVVKVILKLKGNSSPGPDGITSGFLKNVLALIANPLCKVFQKSIEEGVLPDDWKVAHIIPVYKKGDPQLPSQYRPVSLTSIVCKVLERVVRSQLLKYLERNNIIPHCQHGFLPKKSTVTNLIECLDDWTRNFDNGVSTDIVYLDYSKCFDKVCHNKLLYKLSKYGITGSAYNWLRNFITGRVQHVKINSSTSPAMPVRSGVPQGTVLGPILFLCYSADMPAVVENSKLSIYADDTKLYKEIYSVEDCIKLQSDLDNIYNWAKLWQMELNPDKTKLLSIGNSTVLFDYSLDNKAIEKVNHMKDVGVIIQSDLKFTMHCSSIIKKAYFVIRNIFTTFKYHNFEFYLKMYICYVRPILEYGCQVWSPLLKTNIDSVENVQRYYTRQILKNVNYMGYLERLQFLSLKSLEERRYLKDLTLFFKMINDITLLDLENSFRFSNSHRGHDLNLYKFFCRTERRKHFWINRIINVWNKLHAEIIHSSSVYIFKKNVLNYANFVGRGSIFCS